MKRVVVNTRRSLRGGKSQEAPVVLNGHLHGKPNGQGTLHRVEDAIRLSGCSATGEFFRVARHTFPDHAPDQCVTADDQRGWMERELSWFASLGSGNPVPEGYKIPECVRFLADRVLESKNPRKCFEGLKLSSEKKPARTVSSPIFETMQAS